MNKNNFPYHNISNTFSFLPPELPHLTSFSSSLYDCLFFCLNFLPLQPLFHKILFLTISFCIPLLQFLQITATFLLPLSFISFHLSSNLLSPLSTSLTLFSLKHTAVIFFLIIFFFIFHSFFSLTIIIQDFLESF